MGLVWNDHAIPSIVAWLLAWGLAAVIYSAAPRRLQNPLLALMLFTDGAAITAGTGIIYLLDDPAQVYGMQMVNVTCGIFGLALYPLFLSTLDTAIVRPLKHRLVRGTTLVAVAALQTYRFINPDYFVVGVQRVSYAPYDAILNPDYTNTIFWVVAALLLFGALAAFAAYRAAPRASAERARAQAFATAFVTRDVLSVTLFMAFVLTQAAAQENPFTSVLNYISAFPLILFVLLVSYGIVRTHLFDVDLKIKWTIKQSTVAAAFIAVFFIASEAAQAFFAGSLGPYVGIVAAGALVFALAPLQRAADRVANAAMPQ
ncbi:MAG: hypothetical protein HY556_09520 [Euryarchaeota archaeon]|nr:hypothetical protein [Euryarchaeota archaeon]